MGPRDGHWPIRISIRHESDLVTARRHTRELARRQGLSAAATEAVATAVTEIVRNVIEHAGDGWMKIQPAVRGGTCGLVVTVRDVGPGIADVDAAMRDGYTTGKGLGLGLPGARNLVDQFTIESVPERGTTVIMWKWA